jgi:phage-related protein
MSKIAKTWTKVHAPIERIFMKKIILSIVILLSIANAQTFQSLYTKNKKEGIGNYITIDFLLNNLYLHKKEIITEIEKKQLEPKLKKFSYRLLRESLRQRVYDDRLLVYLTTLNMLQNNSLPKVPTHIISQAKEELGKIEKASSHGYRRFKNSGRLKSRQGYFRALTFVTKVPFFINPSTMTGTDINSSNANIKMGLRLANIIKKDRELKSLYTQIDQILKVLFGRADDLGVLAFGRYGVDGSVEKVRRELNRPKNYPKIIGEDIELGGLVHDNKLKSIPLQLLSFRLFSSRYSLDSYLFSRVVFPYVLAPLHGKKDSYTSVVNGKRVRVLPSIWDMEYLFYPPHQENYQHYFKNLKLVQKELLRGLKSTPLSLYEFDFRIYRELLRVKKRNAFRGYYTQNRYLIYAYAKKSHTPTQRSVTIGKKRDKALLERDITNLLGLMIDELDFLYKIDKDKRTKEFSQILKRLKKISAKKRYSREDIEFLNSLDVSLKNIIDERFEPVSVELHYDSNSHRGLIETLKEPVEVKKDGFRGVQYLHQESLENKGQGL